MVFKELFVRGFEGVSVNSLLVFVGVIVFVFVVVLALFLILRAAWGRSRRRELEPAARKVDLSVVRSSLLRLNDDSVPVGDELLLDSVIEGLRECGGLSLAKAYDVVSECEPPAPASEFDLLKRELRVLREKVDEQSAVLSELRSREFPQPPVFDYGRVKKDVKDAIIELKRAQSGVRVASKSVPESPVSPTSREASR